MFFNQITLHNFGIFKGTHTINLYDKDGMKNVTLIGAMNGRGKTTIMEAIFLAFYGARALKEIQDKNTGYSSFLYEHINKSSVDELSYVGVSFSIEGKPLTEIEIIRQWNHKINNKPIKDNIVVFKNGIEDKYLAQYWNFFIEEYFPIGIARFCFFDNEKISRIIDDESFTEMKESIKSAIGIKTVDRLIDDMRKLIHTKETTLDIKDNDNALYKQQTDLDHQLEELDDQIKTYKKDIAYHRSRITRLQKLIEEKEVAFWSRGGELAASLALLKEEEIHLFAKQSENNKEINSLVTNSATPLYLCRGLLDQIHKQFSFEKEEIAKQYAKPILLDIKNQFHDLLVVEDLSIASRDLVLEKIYQVIELNLPQTSINIDMIPSADSLQLLDTLINNKSFIIKDKVNSILLSEENLRIRLEELSSQILAADEGKDETHKLFNDIKDLERQKKEHEISLSGKLDEQKRIQSQYSSLENAKRNIIEKRMQIERDNENDAKTVAYANKTIHVMQEFKRRLQKTKIQVLQKNIENCFKFLSSKDHLITSISIDPYSIDISLKDYNNTELSKSQLSAGEKQMFAISVLWGLSLSSGNNLPLIIDTPLARLDSIHRLNIVQKYLPNASRQVVVLSTDEELYGDYLSLLSTYINSAYTLVFDENEKCSHIVSGYFAEVTDDYKTNSTVTA